VTYERRHPAARDGGVSREPQQARAERNATDRQVHRGRGVELFQQLARRADAARRLPPLAHGRRDPLTPRERAQGRS
jgi:hypothetical protein